MALIDKIFGLVLIVAGLGIAVYYTIWQFLSLVSKPILFLLLYITTARALKKAPSL